MAVPRHIFRPRLQAAWLWLGTRGSALGGAWHASPTLGSQGWCLGWGARAGSTFPRCVCFQVLCHRNQRFKFCLKSISRKDLSKTVGSGCVPRKPPTFAVHPQSPWPVGAQWRALHETGFGLLVKMQRARCFCKKLRHYLSPSRGRWVCWVGSIYSLFISCD